MPLQKHSIGVNIRYQQKYLAELILLSLQL